MKHRGTEENGMDETLAMDRTAPPTPDAPEYPQYWEADVVASDGGVVHLRPILPLSLIHI